MKKVFDNLIAKESEHAAFNIQSWEGVNGKIVICAKAMLLTFLWIILIKFSLFLLNWINCVAEVLCCTGFYSMHGGSHNYNNEINYFMHITDNVLWQQRNSGFRSDIAIDNIISKPWHCWTEVTGQCIVWQLSILWHLVNALYHNPLYYDILSMYCMTTLCIMTFCHCIL